MTDKTWHIVTLQDRETGERSITQEKGVDQDDANQRVCDRIEHGDLAGLLVVVD